MIRPSIYFPKTCCLKKQNLFQDISTLLRYMYYILYCKLKFLGVSPPIHWSIVSYSKTAGFIILCMHGKYVWMHPSELVTFAALMYISSICTLYMEATNPTQISFIAVCIPWYRIVLLYIVQISTTRLLTMR